MTEWVSKANWQNRNWKYVNAASTDITKTIARVRKEMKELAVQEKEEKVRHLKIANK